MSGPGPTAAHGQAAHAVRLEWGPTGAAAVVLSGSPAVVVDVLSFTTTLSVALERGALVHPFAWRDERAAAHAAAHGALLAVGRLEARGVPGAVSLSPAHLLAAPDLAGRAIVLPSPNGSAICAALAGSGATVVGACLRNARAVAAWVAPRALRHGVAVVAAGERWPDGSLRPALEDLWGAGAVLSALVDLGVEGLSPEARTAVAAFRAVRSTLPDELTACASGQELVEAGFADDVRVAGESDVSTVVPVLRDGVFSDGATDRA